MKRKNTAYVVLLCLLVGLAFISTACNKNDDMIFQAKNAYIYDDNVNLVSYLDAISDNVEWDVKKLEKKQYVVAAFKLKDNDTVYRLYIDADKGCVAALNGIAIEQNIAYENLVDTMKRYFRSSETTPTISRLQYELVDTGTAYKVSEIGWAEDSSITIPASYKGLPVVTIGANSVHNDSITNIEIPSSITQIEASAFSYLTSLTSIVIPSSITDIGLGAFEGCRALESISIPFVGASRAAIRNEALFGYIFGKNSYPGGWSVISNIFSYVEYFVPLSLSKIILTEGNAINEGAFYDLSEVNEIILPDSIENIGKRGFGGCSSLSSIELPTELKEIGAYAFANCGLTSINLSEGLINIGDLAFYGCSSLKEIELPKTVRILGNNAFGEIAITWHYNQDLSIENLNILKTVVIPQGVTEIKDKAFYDKYSLTTITIPQGVTIIGNQAFYRTSVKSITVPSTVSRIGNSAFSTCTQLETVSFSGGSNLESIGESAFSNCYALNSIAFPNSLVSIGNYAFRNCSNLMRVQITIPIAVTTIGEEAFSYTYADLYAEAASKPSGWATNWKDNSTLVFWASETRTLTYTAGTGGTISGNASQTIDKGADGTAVTAVPNSGYQFAGWSDGVTTATRRDLNVNGNIAVTASFEPIPVPPTVTLSYTAGTGGTISGNANQTIDKGADGTAVTAVPNSGYEFAGWSDGVTTATRRDLNVNGNIAVTASFEPISTPSTVTLSYTAGTGGTISGNASQTIDKGADGTAVTAVPNSGYQFAGWSDGVITATRRDLNVNGNIAVTASFEPIPAASTVTLLYTAGTGGTISGNANQTIDKGADGTAVTAVPNSGYEFAGWSDGVTTATRQDTGVNASISVNAVFAEMLSNFAGGDGTANYPYLISTEAQLIDISLYPEAHFLLINDIVLPAVNYGSSNFSPLFDDVVMFAGVLDGGGYAVENLTIYNIETYFTGLFACVAPSGWVTNIRITNALISGTNYMGAVAGYSLGNITDCEVSGKVEYIAGKNSFKVFAGGIAGRIEGSLSGNKSAAEITLTDVAGEVYAGGIAGFSNYSENISGINNEGTITVTGKTTAFIGGLVGYSASYITITDAYNTGDITSSSSGSNSYAGGLVGNSSASTITQAYNTGDINSSGSYESYAGGLVGNSSTSTITQAYNTGDITSSSSNGNYSYAGGLVGRSDSLAITQAYNTGDITSSSNGNYSYAGGLVGRSNSLAITQAYNTGDISSNSSNSYAGGLVGIGYDRLTIKDAYNTGCVYGGNYVGGIAGYCGSFVSENVYTVGSVALNSDRDGRLGAVCGYISSSITIKTTYWLYYEGVPYAVGYSDSLGIPTSIGSTKKLSLDDFYSLTDALNAGREESVWTGNEDTLPTIIL